MIETHHSRVTDDQIDHLGHMNVRFYAANALAGTRTLLGPSGGDPVDVYTRHHREQLLGAALVVRSGVLGSDGAAIELYHELRNAESDDLAATFIHRVEGPVDLDISSLDTLRTPLPAAGTPRSIDLGAHPADAVSLPVLRERGLEMRRPRRVDPAECDADGRLLTAFGPGLIWGGEPVSAGEHQLLHEGPNGEVMGFATMESRLRWGRVPSAGDEIQSFGAVVAIAEKTTRHMHWAFALDSGELVCTFEVVNLAFDTTTRRSMVIPDGHRADFERGLQGDLAPGNASPR